MACIFQGDEPAVGGNDICSVDELASCYPCKDSDCSLQFPIFLLDKVGNDEKASPVVAMGAVHAYDLHGMLLEEVESYAVEIIHLHLSRCLPVPVSIYAL